MSKRNYANNIKWFEGNVLYNTVMRIMNTLPKHIYASSMSCLTSKIILYGEKYMVSLDYYFAFGLYRNGDKTQRILTKLSLIEK